MVPLLLTGNKNDESGMQTLIITQTEKDPVSYSGRKGHIELLVTIDVGVNARLGHNQYSKLLRYFTVSSKGHLRQMTRKIIRRYDFAS
ncbi:hypothetical protein NPIL_238341 [Nephila pilipes]|uniref:Uncharacterized protein n=1 Tax=Nephila pilipes TaxID=299642 RepID=A0A8X6PZB8_NEPPI|nr:hypothetical protein NPIL_238341 [Nephila pilipes]